MERLRLHGGTGNDVVLDRLVTPPRPTLTIERIPPASVRLFWATNDPLFRLQSHTNLAASTWISVSPSPGVIGTNHVLTNPSAGRKSFTGWLTRQFRMKNTAPPTSDIETSPARFAENPAMPKRDKLSGFTVLAMTAVEFVKK